ncbi:MAG: Gfo/Idh/MocA family oxidoreductase [Planctomycetes bacterium]|nr:Gfo/Idh/MocA family oxidoreductase [Planctomycetota bacterium]
MKTCRVAVVGLGRMGSTIDDELRDYPAFTLPFSIAAACQASPHLELAAGADILPEKRDAFAERWGVKALYGDYLEMIEKEQPDLVAICTKGDLHAEMIVAVAGAGVKMIFCEKAIACSLKEADAALDACRKNHVSLNTGVLRRFIPLYAKMKEIIGAGGIGKPTAVVHYAAGTLLHSHIHSIDTAMYLLGDPEAVGVWGELRPRDTAFKDNRLDHDPRAIYHIEFAGGIEAFTVPAGGWEFEVIGAEGTLRSVNNGAGCLMRKAHKQGKRTMMEPAPFPEYEKKSGTVILLEDIATAAEQGRQTLGNIEVTHRATELCFAIAESHRLGRRVSLPVENRDMYVFHV